jgi:RNA polymerase sigma-70 factor (ECF subfamily)
MADLREIADERLIPLALEGRSDAWDVLIARHDRRVLLALVARGVRVDRAKELSQEAWTRLIAQQRRGKLTRLELPGLAIAQANYLALDEARRRKDVPLDEAPDVLEVEDPAPNIEARLTSRSALDRARAELDRCPPMSRRVFELVYDEPGVPHAEAAREVGLSVQRVRQIVCEVRARLRVAIGEPS